MSVIYSTSIQGLFLYTRHLYLCFYWIWYGMMAAHVFCKVAFPNWFPWLPHVLEHVSSIPKGFFTVPCMCPLFRRISSHPRACILRSQGVFHFPVHMSFVPEHVFSILKVFTQASQLSLHVVITWLEGVHRYMKQARAHTHIYIWSCQHENDLHECTNDWSCSYYVLRELVTHDMLCRHTNLHFGTTS